MSHGDFGYGQQTPFDSTSKAAEIAFICRRLIARLDTMKLVQVKAVHGGGVAAGPCTVDVQPLVSQVDGGGNSVPHGVVSGIACYRAQGGLSAIVLDPVVGDIGYVVCADRDISNVVRSSAPSTPGSYRRYNIADGVYVGAVLGKAPNQYVFVGPNGIIIHDVNGNQIVMAAAGVTVLDANNNRIVTNASGVTITDLSGNVLQTAAGGITATPASNLFTINGNLALTGNFQIGGNVQSLAGGIYGNPLRTSGAIIAGFGTADQVGLQTHTHTQSPDSHADVEVPTDAPTAGT